MRFNIFRNKHIDAQVGYFIDTMIDARRKETEEYWRSQIAAEVHQSCINTRMGKAPCVVCMEISDTIKNNKTERTF